MSEVHIAWNPAKGDVLSRFYSSLARLTGWGIGKDIPKNVDLVYFGLYIQPAQSPQAIENIRGRSRTAALFSHYETEIPQKVEWWDKAVSMVDIRTTWAEQYLEILLPYGESHIVIPPIDPQFRKQVPRIGVSGYVHPGGRKGESLVKQLAQEFGGRYKIVASGKNWPIESRDVKEYEWSAMPDFYKSLDVLLVTSLTEGIPMPPLEALAMGKPVVVPNGVGLLDSLNDPLVFHYRAGDYQDMKLAIAEALDSGKSAVAGFTEEAWAESHRIAFGLTAGAPIVTNFAPPKPLRRNVEQNGQSEPRKPLEFGKTQYAAKIPKSGACVIAYGAPARDCALTMLQSWKNQMSDYPIALISDAPLGIEDIFIEHPDTDIGARSVKTNLYALAPQEWKHVLYLDADTEIVSNVSVLFEWLSTGWEFLICLNPKQYASIEKGLRPDNREETALTIEQVGSGEIVQFNGGVFGFRRCAAAKRLMQGWYEEWGIYRQRDQQALMRSLHKHPIKYLLLGSHFNTVTRFVDPNITAGILHHPLGARRWTGVIHAALDSEEAWSRVNK